MIPAISAQPPAKTYPLYLPGPFKAMIFAILGAFTLLGFLMVLGMLPADPQGRAIGLAWLAGIGAFWYNVLTTPHRIEARADGRITFVSLARRVQISPLAVQSIKPQGGQLGMFILRHTGGRIRLLGQFDGFHEFLSALKTANPAVELRGC